MNACPDCGSVLKGSLRSCSCGWGNRQGGMTEQATREWTLQKQQNLAMEEARETLKAKNWLTERGIVGRDVAGPDRRKALQAYISTITKAKPGKGWAQTIIEDYEAGKYPHEYGYRLACDAMRHEPVKVERVEF